MLLSTAIPIVIAAIVIVIISNGKLIKPIKPNTKVAASKFGIIPINDNKADLNKMPNFMAIIGRYILTPDIFDILKKIKPNKNGEIQITDALLVQAKKSKIIAYKFKGKRFDCGSVKGYLDACNYFAKQHGIS